MPLPILIIVIVLAVIGLILILFLAWLIKHNLYSKQQIKEYIHEKNSKDKIR